MGQPGSASQRRVGPHRAIAQGMRRPHRGLRYGAAILPTACGMAKTRAAQAIEYFAAQGVAVKEISEDSPLTVPLLPPGSACLTPADRSARETCPRIRTSSAACCAWPTGSSVAWSTQAGGRAPPSGLASMTTGGRDHAVPAVTRGTQQRLPAASHSHNERVPLRDYSKSRPPRHDHPRDGPDRRLFVAVSMRISRPGRIQIILFCRVPPPHSRVPVNRRAGRSARGPPRRLSTVCCA
jgi:hypothetical protein